MSNDDRFTQVKPMAEIISFVEIECRVVLKKGMFSLIHCYDSSMTEIKTYSVELTPDEYNNWVSDDDMQTLILSKVGLVKS